MRDQGTVRLLCGTQRSRRAAHIDGLLREQWGRARLLVPTRRYASKRAETVMSQSGVPGAWGQPVLTMEDFAVELLRDCGQHPIRARDFERRLLLQRAIRDLADAHRKWLGAVADTNGFLSHALRVITQLKQAAVEPEAFRARVERRHGRTPLDLLIADLYASYQKALLESDLYDLPGLFWQTDLACREDPPRLLTHVNALFLDGFDDFTPSEFRLLTSLARHADLLVFGLDYDPDPQRRDQFSVAAKTVRAIQDRFGARIETFEESPPERHTEYAATYLFGADPNPAHDGLRADLEIVPCAGSTEEIEMIGRRVKSLLLEGIPPDEIAVVFRALGEAANTLHTVFTEFGIPIRVVQDPPLWQSSMCAFLLHLIEAISTWEREAVCCVLTSSWFCPQETTADAFRHAVPHLARLAQIVSGRTEWQRRLEALAARIEDRQGEDIESLLARAPAAPQALAALMKQVAFLAELDDRVPPRATPAQYAHILDDLIDETGVEQGVEPCAVSSVGDAERAALAALRNLLGDASSWSAEGEDPVPLSAFMAQFRQALRDTTFRPPQPPVGVSCLDAASVRHLRFDYVFFADVNEGAFPRPPAASAVYSEDDLRGLADAGILIEGKRAHCEREALLFRHVLDVPRERLCITWRQVSRRGKEQQPSPYLGDLIALFPGALIQQPKPRADAFVPPLDQAACERDVRNAAFHYAPDLQRQFPDTAAGAGIEKRRHDKTPFGPYDGIIPGPAATEIAQRFGTEHCFSVQQIEAYIKCPFQFFVERVLDVDDAEAPIAEFDARIRGTILHEILEKFHTRFRGIPMAEIPTGEAVAAMRELVTAEFDETAWRSRTAPPGVDEVEKRHMLERLLRYIEIERDRKDPGWKPSHFEVAFGHVRRPGHDPLSQPEPYPMDTPAGTTLFSGIIDRIDRYENNARIIDYKTSIAVSQGDIEAGRAVQLAVYTLALQEHLMSGAECAAALFVRPGYEKTFEALKRNARKDGWPERERVARQAIADAITAIRKGRFPPVRTSEKACTFCPGKQVCRHETGRIERKERPE
ncbi:MAG: hypothetical protein GWP08_06800 [Nitrospiraceae bacterium]|nr:hypothetical protein [Nitrospiraceae bacterium]